MYARAQRIWEHLSRNNLGLIQHALDACDLDPRNAAEFAGLSHALLAEGLWALVNASAAYAGAEPALQSALDTGLELIEAKCAAAWFKLIVRADWQGGYGGFDGVLRHDPLQGRALAGLSLFHVAEENMKEALSLLGPTKSIRRALRRRLCTSGAHQAGEFAYAFDQANQLELSGRIEPVVCAVKALAYIQLEELISLL